MQINPSKPTLH